MRKLNYVLLGKRIRAIRIKRGMTQIQLAERIELSPTYISYLESGCKGCSLETLLQLANALNVSTDDLLLDSLENTIKVMNHEFATVISDCTEYETRVLLDVIKGTKQSIRAHRNLMRPGRR